MVPTSCRSGACCADQALKRILVLPAGWGLRRRLRSSPAIVAALRPAAALTAGISSARMGIMPTSWRSAMLCSGTAQMLRVAAGNRPTQYARAIPTQAFSAGPVFSIATVLVMPVYTMMLAAPKSKLTKLMVAPPALFVIFAALYISMLPQVAQIPNLLHGLFVQGTTMPQVTALGELFLHESVVTLAWVHLLMLDLFQARYVLLDGIKNNLPTAHSVVLSFMFGPTGLLSHLVTRHVVNWLRNRGSAPDDPQPAT
mmetsp:Transcript_13827/g.35529  ORF Transcript_13827/g.35529 Transcript_13827/m.35529 type:complete len:256 (-) Transcript_13827:71-838(-)